MTPQYEVNFLTTLISYRFLGLLLIGILSTISSSSAATLTQWDFNLTLGGNSNPSPSIGIGTATSIGMNDNADSSDIRTNGSPLDPGTPNHAWRVRGSVANGWSTTTQLLSGARFTAPTTGFRDIIVSMDVDASNGSASHAQFQYTTNGTDFLSFGDLTAFQNGSDAFDTGLTWDLSSISGVNDNPNFSFQLVSAFHPDFGSFRRVDGTGAVGTSGNSRFDMVTVSATAVPEPTGLALLAIASTAGLVARNRRRRQTA